MLTAAMLLGAAPAFAMTGTSTTKMMHKTVDIACVQKAVDTRESAIDTAFGTFSTSISAALTARKSALHAAWGLTDAKERRAARKKAWSDFRSASRAAHKVLKDARHNSWSAFEKAAKACGAPGVESQGGDGIGSIGL